MPFYHLGTSYDTTENYTGNYVELIFAQGANKETPQFITKLKDYLPS